MARAAAQVVVGVVEARVDRAVRGVVDQVQELAGRVVLVGRERAVAQVLAVEPTGDVVVVRHDPGPRRRPSGAPAGRRRRRRSWS